MMARRPFAMAAAWRRSYFEIDARPPPTPPMASESLELYFIIHGVRAPYANFSGRYMLAAYCCHRRRRWSFPHCAATAHSRRSLSAVASTRQPQSRIYRRARCFTGRCRLPPRLAMPISPAPPSHASLTLRQRDAERRRSPGMPPARSAISQRFCASPDCERHLLRRGWPCH